MGIGNGIASAALLRRGRPHARHSKGKNLFFRTGSELVRCKKVPVVDPASASEVMRLLVS